MTNDVPHQLSKLRTFRDDVARLRARQAAADPATPPAPVTSPADSGVPRVSLSGSVPNPATTTSSVPTTPSTPNSQPLSEAIATVVPSIVATPRVNATFDAVDDPLGEGTIVSDKKTDRFHLGRTVTRSLVGWANEQAAAARTPTVPTYVVRKAETRLDTLREAAEGSFQAPQDDYAIVRQRLTETERPLVTVDVNIKEAAEVEAPRWSHTTDAATSASDTRDIDSAGPLERRQPEATLTTPIAVPSQVTTQPADIEPTATPELAPSRMTLPVQKVLPVAPANTIPAAPTPPPEPTVPVAPPPLPQRVATVAPARTTAPSSADNRKFIMITIGVIILAIGLGTSGTVWWFARSTITRDDVTIVRIPSLVAVSLNTPVVLQSGRSEVLQALAQKVGVTRETQQLYLTTSGHEGSALPADTETILNTLEWRAPGAFLRSLKNITFGSFDGTTPFIVIQSSDFDTGFSGMLAWERALSVDLAPLFGEPVTESFDPSARTDSQLRSAFFRDIIVTNVSARLLVDENDNERIVYGFVKPNLILITPNQTAFEKIAPLISAIP